MQMEAVESRMQECLLQVPNASKLLAIKGIGLVSATVVVSEIGDIRRFSDPRQPVSYTHLERTAPQTE